MCKGYTAQYDKHHNSKRTLKKVNISDDTNDAMQQNKSHPKLVTTHEMS
jgi:hypothetical protein